MSLPPLKVNDSLYEALQKHYGALPDNLRDDQVEKISKLVEEHYAAPNPFDERIVRDFSQRMVTKLGLNEHIIRDVVRHYETFLEEQHIIEPGNGDV